MRTFLAKSSLRPDLWPTTKSLKFTPRLVSHIYTRGNTISACLVLPRVWSLNHKSSVNISFWEYKQSCICTLMHTEPHWNVCFGHISPTATLQKGGAFSLVLPCRSLGRHCIMALEYLDRANQRFGDAFEVPKLRSSWWCSLHPE